MSHRWMCITFSGCPNWHRVLSEHVHTDSKSSTYQKVGGLIPRCPSLHVEVSLGKVNPKKLNVLVSDEHLNLQCDVKYFEWLERHESYTSPDHLALLTGSCLSLPQGVM